MIKDRTPIRSTGSDGVFARLVLVRDEGATGSVDVVTRIMPGAEHRPHLGLAAALWRAWTPAPPERPRVRPVALLGRAIAYTALLMLVRESVPLLAIVALWIAGREATR